jgi:hypothetical protein
MCLLDMYGGARSLLERALVKIDQTTKEIDDEVSVIKRKQAGVWRFEIISPAYAQLIPEKHWYDFLAKAVVAIGNFFCFFFC